MGFYLIFLSFLLTKHSAGDKRNADVEMQLYDWNFRLSSNIPVLVTEFCLLHKKLGKLFQS